MATAAVPTEIEARALNGESPRWSVERRRLYWVDTRAGPARLRSATGRDHAWAMPSWIGCAVLSERRAMVSLRTGFYAFHEAKASWVQIGAPPYDLRRFLFNDGGCDPRGRFIVGEMYLPMPPGDEKELAPDPAPLFRYVPNGTWVDMAASTKTSNGPERGGIIRNVARQVLGIGTR